jgi:phosphatidylglycerol---prolipoprotein diacylglyceryl transferase
MNGTLQRPLDFLPFFFSTFLLPVFRTLPSLHIFAQKLIMDLSATLAYIVWNVDSDIFVIPYLNHPVRWYGLSWAFGFLISQQVMYFIYKKDDKPRKDVDDLTIYMLIAAMLGARLGHVLFYDPVHYLSHPLQILAVWEGGLASHGAAIGILAALYFFARRTNVAYLWIVDRLVIVSALTGGMIRIGNLMNSEMVGIPTDVPWAFIFTSVDNIPRHPAQLYEAIYCFLLFGFLLWLWYKLRSRMSDGFLTGWFLIILFSLRFVDEFFKIDQVSFEENLVLNMGQVLSIPFVIAGILILIYSRRNKKTPDNVVSPANETPSKI